MAVLKPLWRLTWKQIAMSTRTTPATHSTVLPNLEYTAMTLSMRPR